MKIRRQFYFLKNALLGMKRNGEMTVTAIITVTSCLLLFGVFMLLSANINQIGNQIRNQCQIQAFIEFEATAEQEQAVVNALNNKEKFPNIKKCTFVSKADAMREYREYLGTSASAFDGVEGEEFLRSSVKIDMHDITKSKELAAQLANVQYIAKVSNRQDVVDRIISVTDTIKNASFIAMLILLFVAVFIIANTIKLSVEARKDEIHIMKYVGATAGFVRRPFVLEGILTGVIGGVISLVIVSVGYNYAIKFMKDFLDIFTLIPFGTIFPFMLGTTLVFGVIMGAVGSAIALSKHLKV
ncbi:MAG: permease-like cell division protein FtsX [Clostridia bacterium]|nr:permease-like cell division protein FtsX [Clostridia bacterium]